MDGDANLDLPAAKAGTNRMLYFFRGETLTINGVTCTPGHGIQVDPTVELRLENGSERTEILVLQARPIGEPVARYGPFVMNTQRELQEAYQDYQATQFGGWPWASRDPAHGDDGVGRFAQHKG